MTENSAIYSDEYYDLGPQFKQPKNSWRYFPVREGQTMTSLYIQKNSVAGEVPPRRIRVRIEDVS